MNKPESRGKLEIPAGRCLKTASMNKPESSGKLEIPAPTIGDVEVTTLKDNVMR